MSYPQYYDSDPVDLTNFEEVTLSSCPLLFPIPFLSLPLPLKFFSFFFLFLDYQPLHYFIEEPISAFPKVNETVPQGMLEL